MTSDFDQIFGGSPWPSFRWPSLRTRLMPEAAAWSPGIDVFERDNRLVTKVDLPGMKKEDVKVEVTDGHLAISGERRSEAEEKKDNFYRCEREYGSFYRAVPARRGEARRRQGVVFRRRARSEHSAGCEAGSEGAARRNPRAGTLEERGVKEAS
jgi:HSP20 family molecular chaperone IbpA